MLGLPIISSPTFEMLGTIDNYISFIWTSRYYSEGDFEITCGADAKAVELLKVGNYVSHKEDTNYGIIESIEANITEAQQFVIVARGRFLPVILARRVVAVQTQLKGLLSESVYTLLNDALINPAIEARRVSNFTHGEYVGTHTVDRQITGTNLLQAISEICMPYGVGFNVYLTDNLGLEFDLFEGVDRSYDQTERPAVIFSDRYENLLTSSLVKDKSSVVTDVLVAGEGEGLERVTTWTATDTKSGLDRYELYYDARSVRSVNGTKMSEYIDTLKQEGLSKVTEYTEAFTGTVDFTKVVYKKDINLGDICTIENNRLGVYINSRLVEVIESIDHTGAYQAIPTFGS